MTVFKDWGKAFFDSTEKYFGLTHIFGHFPIVMKLVNNAPTWALQLFIHNLSEMSEKKTVRAHTFISLHTLISLFVSLIKIVRKEMSPSKAFSNFKKKNPCFFNRAEVEALLFMFVPELAVDVR